MIGFTIISLGWKLNLHQDHHPQKASFQSSGDGLMRELLHG